MLHLDQHPRWQEINGRKQKTVSRQVFTLLSGLRLYDIKLGMVYLPSATVVAEGNVFTPVCDSVHGREGAWVAKGAWW